MVSGSEGSPSRPRIFVGATRLVSEEPHPRPSLSCLFDLICPVRDACVSSGPVWSPPYTVDETPNGPSSTRSLRPQLPVPPPSHHPGHSCVEIRDTTRTTGRSHGTRFRTPNTYSIFEYYSELVLPRSSRSSRVSRVDVPSFWWT